MKEDIDDIHFERGLYFFQDVRLEDALEEFKLFLESARKKNDLEEMAMSLNAIGRTHAAMGTWEEAVRHFERALAVYDALGDERGLAILYYDIGRLNLNLDRLEKAEEFIRKSIESSEKSGEPEGVMTAGGMLVQVLRKKNDLQGALAIAKVGLEHSRRMINMYEEANFLSDLSNILREMDEQEEAIEYSEAALDLAEKTGNQRQAMVALGQLGQIHRKIESFASARKYSIRGLDLARKLGDLNETAIFLQDLARIHENESELDKAEEKYIESMSLFVDTGNAAGVVYNLKNLSRVKHLKGDNRGSVRYFMEALSTAVHTDFSLFNSTVLELFSSLGYLLQGGFFEEVSSAAVKTADILEGIPDEFLGLNYKYALIDSMRALELYASVDGDLETASGREAIKLAAQVDETINLGFSQYLESNGSKSG